MNTQIEKLKQLKARFEQLFPAPETVLTPATLTEIFSLLQELDSYRLSLELKDQQQQQLDRQLQDLNQDYFNLYNSAPVAYFSLDTDGVIRHANRTLGNLLGIAGLDARQARFSDYIKDSDQALFHNYRQALLAGQTPPACELRLRGGGQTQELWVKCEGFLIHASANKDINFVITDISLLKSLEDDLRLGASIFDESAEAIMIAASDLTILKVNHAYSRITGYTAAEAIGKKSNLLKSGRHDAAFYKEMWDAINQHDHWQGEIWNKRKNGEIYPEWLNISARKNSLNQTTHYIGIFSDITSQKDADSRIHFLAYYDALTKLPNRSLLQDRIKYTISRSRRSKKHNALMLLDLDHFKVINDSLGHEVGDNLLIEVAKRLAASVREEDTVSRLGGDEFVILLHELHQEHDAAKHIAAGIAGKICTLLAEPIKIGNHLLHIGASIGITVFHGMDGHNADLIKNADNAMYKAKDAGRNQYEFYTPEMKIHADSRLLIENELRSALDRGQLELYYQPQTDILSNRICGAEALLRWNHPEKGLVPPGSFIAIAEQTGLIVPIGVWVLQTACRHIAAWNHAGDAKHLSYVAVNVSPHQFQLKNFVAQVSSCIAEAGIDAGQLELELTEGVLIQNIGDTLEKLKALKALGVRIAIDDFGTGYSSLNYLKRFPLDTLKIDQSFVRDISSDPNDAAIVQTIIALAANLNLRVMAEGVETEQQLAFLRDRKCDSFQGYLCSRPLPQTDFIALLQAQND